jgi:hypothetical protein
MFVPGDDISVLLIFGSRDVKDLSSFIDNVSTFVSPELPPS